MTLKNKEAAELIGITPATLRFWRCKGKGPRYTKLHHSKQAGVRYDLADIEAWKADRTFESTSAYSPAADSGNKTPISGTGGAR